MLAAEMSYKSKAKQGSPFNRCIRLFFFRCEIWKTLYSSERSTSAIKIPPLVEPVRDQRLLPKPRTSGALTREHLLALLPPDGPLRRAWEGVCARNAKLLGRFARNSEKRRSALSLELAGQQARSMFVFKKNFRENGIVIARPLAHDCTVLIEMHGFRRGLR